MRSGHHGRLDLDGIDHHGAAVRERDLDAQAGTPADVGESLRIRLDEQRQRPEQGHGELVLRRWLILVQAKGCVRFAVGEDRQGAFPASYSDRCRLAVAVKEHRAELGRSLAVAEDPGGKALGFQDRGARGCGRGEHADYHRGERMDASRCRLRVAQHPGAEQYVDCGTDYQGELEPDGRHQHVHGEQHAGDGAEGICGVHLADCALAAPAAQQHLCEKRQRHSCEESRREHHRERQRVAEQVEQRIGAVVALKHAEHPRHPVECPVVDEYRGERCQTHENLHQAGEAHRVGEPVDAAADPQAAEREAGDEGREHQLERVERRAEHQRQHPDPDDLVDERGETGDEGCCEKQAGDGVPGRRGAAGVRRGDGGRLAQARDGENRRGEREVECSCQPHRARHP